MGFNMNCKILIVNLHVLRYDNKDFRGCGGMVDATDLKSVDRKVVWVQVPSPPSHFMTL